MIQHHRKYWFLLGGMTMGLGLYIGVCMIILNILITPQMLHTYRLPTELGFAGAKTLNLESASDGITLRGWIVPANRNQVVILIHGIHGHAWDCQAPNYVRAYNNAGLDVFLFDLRGHGQSEGEHIGLGLTERGDIRAAIDALLKQGYLPGHIGLHGSSYGASVALLAAAQIGEVGAVVADSAYATVIDVVGGELERRTGLPSELAVLFQPGLNFLALLKYSLDIDKSAPEEAIGEISPRPILLIHGIEDTIIHHENAHRLKAAAGPAAELWLIPGDHIEGVRLNMSCGDESPTNQVFLRKVTRFFANNLGG